MNWWCQARSTRKLYSFDPESLFYDSPGEMYDTVCTIRSRCYFSVSCCTLQFFIHPLLCQNHRDLIVTQQKAQGDSVKGEMSLIVCVRYQNNQADLENATEVLSGYLERDISQDSLQDIKQKVQDKYR